MKPLRIYLYAVMCLVITLAIPNATGSSDTSENGGLSIIQRPETIRISEAGRIYVGEHETRLNQLARRLRREGVSQEDTIYVSIQDETPRGVLVAVSRELATRGYRRVIFTRPPRAVAETEGNENQ